MTYLETPRLHFAGSFQAAPSTVNNAVENYLGPVTDAGWNAEGTGVWRPDGCVVTGVREDLVTDDAVSPDPVAGATLDPVAGAAVLGGFHVSAKLVDLDPEQQLASQIWGLTVRLVGEDGSTLLSGSFVPASFVDLWRRCGNAGGMVALGAFFQSTLVDLRWDGLDASPFLRRLHDRSPDRLSIKFNVDGYQPNPSDPRFTRGRLVGTIGPAAPDEPGHFVARRLLRGAGIFAPATVDAGRKRLTVDLGNALPTVSPGGPLAPAADGYSIAVRVGGDWQDLAAVDPTTPGFYEQTAGVVELDLSDDEVEAVEDGHLGFFDGDTVRAQEAESRVVARADQLVFRLNPGDVETVEMRVVVAGHPPPSPVTLDLVPGGGLGDREPAGALSFPSSVLTDADGRATFEIRAGDPGGVRAGDGLDGQVYGLGWALPGDLAPDAPDPWEFLSVLVWDRYPEVAQPTWYGHVQPILVTYHRLYPVMARIVDLSDYDSVLEHLDIMALSFNLPLSDANHMPVTRDLSRAKHDMLRRWFEAPLRGRRPPTVAPHTRGERGAARESSATPGGFDDLRAAKSGEAEPHA